MLGQLFQLFIPCLHLLIQKLDGAAVHLVGMAVLLHLANELVTLALQVFLEIRTVVELAATAFDVLTGVMLSESLFRRAMIAITTARELFGMTVHKLYYYTGTTKLCLGPPAGCFAWPACDLAEALQLPNNANSNNSNNSSSSPDNPTISARLCSKSEPIRI